MIQPLQNISHNITNIHDRESSLYDMVSFPFQVVRWFTPSGLPVGFCTVGKYEMAAIFLQRDALIPDSSIATHHLLWR